MHEFIIIIDHDFTGLHKIRLNRIISGRTMLDIVRVMHLVMGVHKSVEQSTVHCNSYTC